MNRPLQIIIIITILVISGIYFIFKKPNTNNEVVFWTLQMSDFAPYINGVINDFEKENPDIKIKWVDVPFSEGEKRTLASVLSDNPPDLVNLNPDFSATLAHKGALWEIQKSKLTQFNDEILKSIETDGKMFSIPWYATSAITIYNKDLISFVPKTYGQLAEIAPQIRKKGAYITLPNITENDTMLKILNKYPKEKKQYVYTLFKNLYSNDLIPKETVTMTLSEALEKYMSENIALIGAGANFLNMIKETSGDCYEDSRSLNQQLTFERASDYFAKKGIDFARSQMRTLNLIGEDNTFTNLAMLLSDQCVHTLKLAIFQGSQKTVFLDRHEFTGSLLEQLEEAFSYIDLSNRTKAEFIGLERLDKRNYPPEAIREALLNAIVHRDYSISASTLISMFDDRIEFVSVGGLVRGISFDDIMLGVSVLRNPHLANVFYRLRLIEAYGTGILKIHESYADCTKKPKIEVSNNAFKVTLSNINFISEHEKNDETITKSVPQNERQDFIMKLFNNHEVITRKDIEIALKVSQATAILIIREMLTQGQIVKEKGGKYSCYKRGNLSRN